MDTQQISLCVHSQALEGLPEAQTPEPKTQTQTPNNLDDKADSDQ
jgi:hypothetical protein